MHMSATEYEDSLAHYGILRKSGRYPWGSGKDPHQRSMTFFQVLEEHKKAGLKDPEIAKLYSTDKHPFTVADLRAAKTHAVHIRQEAQIRQAETLAAKGMSNSAIARQMGVNESTVRSLRTPGRLDRLNVLHKTADMLKRQVDEKGMIDVGAHVERDLPIGDHPETRIGISKDKFNTALSMLKEEGYAVTTFKGKQVGTGENTTYRVLFKPSKPNMSPAEIQKEAWLNRENLQVISEKSDDGGRTFRDMAFARPLGIHPDRVGVRYKEDGGAEADGVIYVRPGVKDIELGGSHYAQVRINVGDTHFLKGMAIYKTDLPKGVDLMFNTNKSNTGNKLDAMKKLKKIPLRDAKGNIVKDHRGNVVDSDKVDWNNPFGAFPKFDGGQIKDTHGNVTSVMNKLREQGDWNTWSRTLSRQMLSKQSPELAKSQLDLTYERRKQEFEELKALTNPAIKRKLLETFSEEADSAAVYLKAANMPRQATRVLLPVSGMKPDEVYAPSFKNGERVSLVRFPHAGPFEIPQLTVNNNNPEAKKLLTSDGKIQAPDAIGIHPKVAERLSGADFDGDTVVVIPNRGVIESRPALEGLKNFDPQKYKVPTPEEDPVNGRYTVPKDATKQDEMGKVTNLIADMTIRGASDEALAAAVRHSMVVIDAEKHNLDYKASERENGIIALKKRWQGENEKTGQARGASTLITLATSQARPVKRKDMPLKDENGNRRTGLVRTAVGTINVKTGEKVYQPTGEVGPTGKAKTFESKKLAETNDARSLLSEHGGTRIEQIYADHSNRLKALANESRKELVNTKPERKDPSAAKAYAKEVAELNAQLNDALKNAPLERRAQSVANFVVKQRRQANGDMEAAELRKIKGQALEEARARTGAKKHQVEITDAHWRAIQANAISIDKMKNILNNTDIEKLKERATPRDKKVVTPAITSRALAMHRAGATYAEMADALGISESTLQTIIKEGG